MRFSATPVEYKVPPPLVGEHTDEILRGLLGKDDGEIAALRSAGTL
jgi:formyl-CoA transferase